MLLFQTWKIPFINWWKMWVTTKRTLMMLCKPTKMPFYNKSIKATFWPIQNMDFTVKQKKAEGDNRLCFDEEYGRVHASTLPPEIISSRSTSTDIHKFTHNQPGKERERNIMWHLDTRYIKTIKEQCCHGKSDKKLCNL